MDRTITTAGTGVAKAVPDAVEVTLSVEVAATTPAEALTGCGEVQAAVLAALGVTASAGGVSVRPMWDHERNRQGKPQASSTVHARLPDLATAGAVVTAALEAGGTSVRLDSMDAVVSDQVAARSEAQAAAFANAELAASQYALLAGGRLGGVLEVAAGARLQAHGKAAMRAAAAPSFEMADGAQDVAVSVTVTWELTD